MGYYIDDIINSEYTKIRMVFNDDEDKDNTLITGFMTDDTFALGGNVSWGELSDGDLMSAGGLSGALGSIATLASKFGGIGQVIGKAKGALEVIGGLGGWAATLAGIGGKLIQQTVAKWEGTEKPTFDVGLMFIRTSSKDDRPEKKARYIMARCYPHSYTGVMRSPMGYIPAAQLLDAQDTTSGRFYNAGADSKHTGTCTLAIGKWFMATNLLLQSASFEFSKECTADGSPLYAQGKVQFISARAVTYNEYQSWFILDNGTSNYIENEGVFSGILSNARYETSGLSGWINDLTFNNHEVPKPPENKPNS